MKALLFWLFKGWRAVLNPQRKMLSVKATRGINLTTSYSKENVRYIYPNGVGTKTLIVWSVTFFVSFLSLSAFPFKPDDTGHAKIVKEALENIEINIDGSIYKFSDKAMVEIQNGSKAVDCGGKDGDDSCPFACESVDSYCGTHTLPGGSKLTNYQGEVEDSTAHCDGEQLSGCSQRVYSIKKYISDLMEFSTDFYTKGKIARETIGRSLHTVQDFYAHSNWVDLGNTETNGALLEGSLSSPPIGKVFCNTDGVNKEFEGTLIKDNISLNDITSGYFPPLRMLYADAILSTEPVSPATDSWHPPVGKCGHGWPHHPEVAPNVFAPGIYYRPGIAKDTPYIDKGNETAVVPNYQKAYELAVNSTKQYVEGILHAQSKESVKNIMALDEFAIPEDTRTSNIATDIFYAEARLGENNFGIRNYLYLDHNNNVIQTTSFKTFLNNIKTRYVPALATNVTLHTSAYTETLPAKPLGLLFPIEGKTPYDTKMTSYFDHSGGRYSDNGEIINFKGEFASTRPYYGATINGVNLNCYHIANTGVGRCYDGHPGYDYGSVCGKSVLAVADGTVTATNGGVCGGSSVNSVEILHTDINGSQLLSCYLHMNHITAKLGTISRGDPIGIVSNVGAPGGCHLHFETRIKDGSKWIPVDPYGWEGAGSDPYAFAVNKNLWNDIGNLYVPPIVIPEVTIGTVNRATGEIYITALTNSFGETGKVLVNGSIVELTWSPEKIILKELPIQNLQQLLHIEILDAYERTTVDTYYPFMDVTPNEWFIRSLMKMWREVIVQESSNGKFRPQNAATRAEFVTATGKAWIKSTNQASCEAINGDRNFFTGDVVPADWFACYASLAYAREAVSIGYSSTNPTDSKPYFFPHNLVDRAAATRIIMEMFKDKYGAILDSYKKGAAPTFLFSDVNDKSSWYFPYVYAAKEAGVVYGTNNIFRPGENVTRAEMMQMLCLAAYGPEECLKAGDIKYEINASNVTVYPQDSAIQFGSQTLGDIISVKVNGSFVRGVRWEGNKVVFDKTLIGEAFQSFEKATINKPAFIEIVTPYDGGYYLRGYYPFLDVKPKVWFTKPVIRLWKDDVIQGFEVSSGFKGLYKPNENALRAELVVAVTRALNAPLVKPIQPPFVDVNIDDWFAPHIDYAKQQGFIKGYSSGNFYPTQPMTRAEAMVVVALAFPRVKEALNTCLTTQQPKLFQDVEPSAWYAPYVCAARMTQVIGGYRNSGFLPNKSISRAEMAKVICIAKYGTLECLESGDLHPLVNSVSPESSKVNTSTIFIVKGFNLPNTLKFELIDCSNSPISALPDGTPEQQRFECILPTGSGGKHNAKIVNQEGILLYKTPIDVQGEVVQPSVPKVTSVSPLTATLGQLLKISVIGENLPDTTALWIANCVNVVATGGTAQKRDFECTPSNDQVGSQEGVVKDKPDGTILSNFNVNVSKTITGCTTPTVSSVSPLKATLNQNTTFTVNGNCLTDTTAFWIGECANLTNLGGTETQRQYQCTPSYSTGSKQGVVKDQSGGTVLFNFNVDVSEIVATCTTPIVSSVSPLQVTLDEPATFTVSGSCLTDTTAFWIDACASPNASSIGTLFPIAGGTATQRKFQCTPSYSTGSKQGVVKDQSAGTVLSNFSVNVIAGTPKVTAVSPLTAKLNQSTTFTVTGSNLPDTTAFFIPECANLVNSGGSTTERKFQCTPSYTTGSKSGVVKDKSGGSTLYSFNVAVQ